jgi:serine/threonine protein kinase
MGVVYAATHTELERIDAIKLLQMDYILETMKRSQPALAADEQALSKYRDQVSKRFKLEARSAAKIKHANVVSVYDYEVLPNDEAYILMEMVEGFTLQKYLTRVNSLPIHDVLSIGHQVASGMQSAHRHAIVHRDLKPANIMLAEREEYEGGFQAKVVDFGLAKFLEETLTGGGLTASGMMLGTPQYMSPEQWRGDDLTVNSDLYSLGAILFEMLAGQPVFQAKTLPAMMNKHLTETPPRIRDLCPDVPEALEQLVNQLLQKNPNERGGAAGEVARRLRELEQRPDILAQINPPMGQVTTSQSFEIPTVIAGLDLPTVIDAGATPSPQRREARQTIVAGAVRIYDLAKELKMESKRIIEYVRSQGIDVSVPSNRISAEMAEKVRNADLTKKEELPREFVVVTFTYQHSIPGRAQPVVIHITVQLYCDNPVAFLASGVGDLEAWVKDALNVILKRHLIGKTYVDLLLRFAPLEQNIKRELSARAADVGYKVDPLVSIPHLKEFDLVNPFDLSFDGTFDIKLDNFEVQLKFDLKLCVPNLQTVEKYLNREADVKEEIKGVVLSEARQILRNIHPERFYLYFNHPNEEATEPGERQAVKELLDEKIAERLRQDFGAEILGQTTRVGRTDLTERYNQLCFVIREFSVSIEPHDPQGTESLVLTGNFEVRGIYSDSNGWQRFSSMRLDLDGLQTQLQNHLKSELKTYYQSGFIFQNRVARREVFKVVESYATQYMRREFGLIVHLTNLDLAG